MVNFRSTGLSGLFTGSNNIRGSVVEAISNFI